MRRFSCTAVDRREGGGKRESKAGASFICLVRHALNKLNKVDASRALKVMPFNFHYARRNYIKNVRLINMTNLVKFTTAANCCSIKFWNFDDEMVIWC